MTASDLRRWRLALRFSQREAAEALGVSRRMYIHYENGWRRGRRIEIPRKIALACQTLESQHR